MQDMDDVGADEDEATRLAALLDNNADVRELMIDLARTLSRATVHLFPAQTAYEQAVLGMAILQMLTMYWETAMHGGEAMTDGGTL